MAMDVALTLDQLIRWIQDGLSVVVQGDTGSRSQQPVTGVVTDSRQVTAGDVFVALRGDRFDGHNYVAQTLETGAIAAVVDTPVPDVPDGAGVQLVVGNTLAAYQAIARGWRRQFDIPIMAITGSAGKTSTKETIAAVLGTAG
ncbi:MAG: Mur ligase domain-containing protein, partial [Cyanobacteria bacterium P01_H01_bin.130]